MQLNVPALFKKITKCCGVFFTGAVLFLLPSPPSLAEESQPKQQWVVVTRSVISCGDVWDNPKARQRLFNTLANPPSDGRLPENCALLKVGDKYLLDDQQSDEDARIVVKMWAPVCPKGCSPTMTPNYAPPRQLIGAYLRPTDPPEGW